MADDPDLLKQVQQQQQQVSQQASQVNQAKQSALQMRTVEAPTVSQLLQRGQAGALIARETERQMSDAKAAQLAQVKAAEAQVAQNQAIVAQNQAIVAQNQAAYNKAVSDQADYSKGYNFAQYSRKTGELVNVRSYSPAWQQGWKDALNNAQMSDKFIQNYNQSNQNLELKNIKQEVPASYYNPLTGVYKGPPSLAQLQSSGQPIITQELPASYYNPLTGSYTGPPKPTIIKSDFSIFPYKYTPLPSGSAQLEGLRSTASPLFLPVPIQETAGKSLSGLGSYLKATPISTIASNEFNLIKSMWTNPNKIETLKQNTAAEFNVLSSMPVIISRSPIAAKIGDIIQIPEKAIELPINVASARAEQALQLIGGTGEIAFGTIPSANPLQRITYARPVFGFENSLKNRSFNVLSTQYNTNDQSKNPTISPTRMIVSTMKTISSSPIYNLPGSNQGEQRVAASSLVKGGLELGSFINPVTGPMRLWTYPASVGGKLLTSEPVSLLEIGAGGAMAYQDIKQATGIIGSAFFSKAQQEVPTEIQKETIQQFSGRATEGRPTVFLKDTSGRYIFGREPKTGISISAGGAAKAGETAEQAAYRELGEEALGLKNPTFLESFVEAQKAGINLKPAGTYVFPEETFNVFTATVPDVSKLTAGSDIGGGFSRFSGDNPFLQATGQTGFQPIARWTPTGSLRSYEAAIMHSMETGEPVTWLYEPTAMGKQYIGTASRYDVPSSSQAQYNQPPTLQLSHANPKGIISSIWSSSPRELTVSAEISERGSIAGLHESPPVSPFGTTTTGNINSLNLIRQTNTPDLSNPFKVPTYTLETVNPDLEPPGGYVALSYAGYKVPGSEELGLKIGGNKPSAILTVGPPSESIMTPKALAGGESERLYVPGTVIQSVGRASGDFIGGKFMTFQPAIVKTGGTLSKVILSDVASSPGYYNYIAPSTLVSSSLISTGSTNLIPSSPSITTSPSKLIIGPSRPSFTASRPNIAPSKPSFGPSASFLPSPSVSISQPSLSPISSISTISSPSVISVPSQSSTSSTPYITPPSIDIGIFGESKKKRKSETEFGKRRKAYQTYVKSRGKFLAVGRPQEKSEALRLGENIAINKLIRTFKVVPTSTDIIAPQEKQYTPSAKIFRGYQIRRGQRIQLKDTFIQRRRQNLKSIGEKIEIKAARRSKQSFKASRRMFRL